MTPWNRRLTGSLALVSLMAFAPVGAQPTSEWYGQPVSGGFIWVETPPGTDLRWQGEPVVVSAPRTLIPVGRDEQGTFELERTLAGGDSRSWPVEIDNRLFVQQRVNGVPRSTVNPDEAQRQRMIRDAQLTRAARASASNASVGATMPFAWPVFGRVTGVYGSQRWYNGEPGSVHWGIDVAQPTGTPVLAPADGQVTLAADLFLSGNTVFIDHGQQLTSAFLHLSRVAVDPGDWVRQGDRLGEVGSTGRSTGPHLDWRMDVNGVRIDPELWVAPQDEICTLEGQGEEAVVLLHGLGRTSLSMEDLAGSLRDAGYVTCNQGYPSRDRTIQSLAPYVAGAVQRARAAGHERISFVTHSMGGIILRYYLGYSSHSVPGRVVMMAPPNHGSEVVDLLEDFPAFEFIMGPAALQLSTDSDSLPNRLPPVTMPVGVIAGEDSSDPWFSGLFEAPHDGKVSVDSTRMVTMTDHIVMPVGHTFMMHNSDVHAEVLRFLDEGSFSR